MRIISWCFLIVLLAAECAFADNVSFDRVQVANSKGKLGNAVLTFSDTDKAIEVRPVKGDAVTIPYASADKYSYEFTRKHRIKAGFFVMLVDIPAGVVVMCTKSTRHWLVMHYNDQDVPRTYIVRMHKHEYLRILDAVKAHTGKEVEVLGNADKRR